MQICRQSAAAAAVAAKGACSCGRRVVSPPREVVVRPRIKSPPKNKRTVRNVLWPKCFLPRGNRRVKRPRGDNGTRAFFTTCNLHASYHCTSAIATAKQKKVADEDRRRSVAVLHTDNHQVSDCYDDEIWILIII